MKIQRLFMVVATAERTFFDQKLLARRRPLTSFSGRGRWGTGAGAGAGAGAGTGIAVVCFNFLFLAARLLPEMERTSDLRGARNSLRGFGAAAIEVSTTVAVEVMTIIIRERRRE